MNSLRHRIVNGWSFQRVMFLALGAFIVVQAAMEQQWMGALFGGYFALMGLFGMGCASGSCYAGNYDTATQKPEDKTGEDVNYEEVK